MSFPTPCSPRLPLAALALLLAACGDDTSGTASVSGSSSSGNSSTGDTTPTPTTVDTVPTTTDEPTAGSMSQSGSSSDTTDTSALTSTSTSPGTTTTGPDDTSTTEPVQTDTGSSTANPDTTTTGEPGSSSSGDESSTGDTASAECACPDLEVALDDGIFVLSDNAELWKFFPETKQFQELGAFNCGGMTNTFSMAVDRLGYAWVMFNNPQGDIWKLDVTNVNNCIDPGFNQGQQGVNFFGMAYVSNSASDVCDKLYGNTWNGIGGFGEGPNIGDFLTVDPDTLQLSKLGKTNFNGAELSGTGDGRAFMFGGANPAKLVEVDKTNGAFLETTPLPGLNLTNAFAFAFFAGDFYLFTESNNPLLSKVTLFDYDDSDMNGQQDLTTYVAQAPIRIVGAGVSTCAPFVPM